MPAVWRASRPHDRPSLCDGRSFGLKVDSNVLVRRDDALVPEPMGDGAEIHPGLEQMNGSAVAHTVRMNAFPRKCRACLCRLERVPPQYQSRSESRELPAAMITKQWLRLTKIDGLVFAVLFE